MYVRDALPCDAEIRHHVPLSGRRAERLAQAGRRKWLKCRVPMAAFADDRIDGAITRREAGTVLGLFAPDAPIRATVRATDGSTNSMDISRQEFVDSSMTAIQGLTDFRQRRVSVEG